MSGTRGSGFLQGFAAGALTALVAGAALVYALDSLDLVAFTVLQVPAVQQALGWAYRNLGLSLVAFALCLLLYLHGLQRLRRRLRTQASALLLFLIMVMGINLMLWVMPYILLTTSTERDPAQLHALVQFCFDAHEMGVFVWQLFFGVHLLAMGWLILKSDLVPHLLGRGLFIGAFGYLIQGIAKLTFVDVAAINYIYIALLVIVTISEISFGLWLLIGGGHVSPKTIQSALASA